MKLEERRKRLLSDKETLKQRIAKIAKDVLDFEELPLAEQPEDYELKLMDKYRSYHQEKVKLKKLEERIVRIESLLAEGKEFMYSTDSENED